MFIFRVFGGHAKIITTVGGDSRLWSCIIAIIASRSRKDCLNSHGNTPHSDEDESTGTAVLETLVQRLLGVSVLQAGGCFELTVNDTILGTLEEGIGHNFVLSKFTSDASLFIIVSFA